MKTRDQLLCESLNMKNKLNKVTVNLSSLIPDWLFLGKLEFESIKKNLIDLPEKYKPANGTYLIMRYHNSCKDHIEQYEPIALVHNDVHALDLLKYHIHDPEPSMIDYTYAIFTMGYNVNFSITTHENDISDTKPNKPNSP